MQTRITASIDASEGVERDERGLPTAWRIWRFGDNNTEHGPTVFSKRSAKLLIAQQAKRGVRIPIDYNHRSLKPDAAIEDQRAAGWHSLEVRADGLWAVNVEWTDLAADLIRNKEFRYFSPAYDVNRDTAEVVGYTNMAICNLPATHGILSLAASRGFPMNASSRVPTDVLRVTASSAPSAELRMKATQELQRRGVQVTDPDSPDGRRLAAMRRNAGLDPESSWPRREGNRQYFPAMTPSEARRFLASRGR